RMSSCEEGAGRSTPRVFRRSLAESFASGGDPFVRRAQAVRERGAGAPAELAPGAADVEHAAKHLAEARGGELRRGVARRDLRARTVEFEHARLAARADVEDAAVAADRGEHRVDDVADEHEVARLAAVAEDRGRLPACHPLEEDRDHAALEARL